MSKRYVFAGTIVLALLFVFFRLYLNCFATFGIDAPLMYSKAAEPFNSLIRSPYFIPIAVARNAYMPGSGVAIIYALPMLISKSPVFVGMITTLLQLLGVYFMYLIFVDWFSRRTALITSILMLFNPWLVYYSIGIWHANLIFVFSCLSFFSLQRLYLEKYGNKTLYWGLLALALGGAVQMHMSSFLLIFLSVLFLVFFRIKPDWKALLIFPSVIFLIFFPYIREEIANNYSNTKAVLSGTTGTIFRLESLIRSIHFSIIFTSTEITHFAGGGIKKVFAFYSYSPYLSIISIIGSLLTAYISYVIFVVFIKKNANIQNIKANPMFFMFLTAFVANPLIYFFTPRIFSPHSLIVIAPLLWIPLASFVENPHKLYLPLLKPEHVFALYIIGALTAIYLTNVINPNQVPAKSVIKIAEYMGRKENTPFRVIQNNGVIELDAFQALHKHYFKRDYYPFAVLSDKEQKLFSVLDNRKDKTSFDNAKIVYKVDNDFSVLEH